MSADGQPRMAGERYKPRLFWAMRRGLGDFYDRLGLMVVASAVMMVPAVLLLLVSQVLAAVLGQLLVSVLVIFGSWYLVTFGWGACVLVAHRISYLEDPGPDAFREFPRSYGMAAFKLSSFQLLITAILAFDTVFFLRSPALPLQIVGVITAYISLIWSMAVLWQWPFMLHEGKATLRTVKKSILVVLDNPFFTLGAFLVTILAGALLLASGIGALAVMGGLLSCFLVRAHRELLKKYEMVEDEPEVSEVDEGWPSGGDPPRRLNPRDWPHNRETASEDRQDDDTQTRRTE